MALHNTQCPHCFTTYVISEEQYRVSDGIVRCGTCRESFKARLEPQTAIPRLDQNSIYIEPISQEIESESETDVADLEESHKPISFDEIKRLVEVSSESMHSELSLTFDEYDSTQIDNTTELSTQDIVDSIEVKEERRKARISKSLDVQESDTQIDASADNLDTQLIDQMDELIDEKLVNETPTSINIVNAEEEKIGFELEDLDLKQEQELKAQVEDDSVETPETEVEDTFSLKPKKTKTGFFKWFMLPILSAACLCLVAVLIYQLWFRQVVFFDTDSQGDRVITSVASELNQQIGSRSIALPLRRDLSKLELVSARAKAHPNRASTILLEVGLINHAKIAQEMPWLELTLFTQQGSLISRRNLSPEHYSYNNTTAAVMTPKEYRRLSIELLSFPKNATGYELKLLSR